MRSVAPLVLSLAAGVQCGTLSVPVTKPKFEHRLGITKRDTIDLTAYNNITGGGYYAEFEIGTPGQKLSFLLDTGSSDTWFNTVDTDLCNSVSLQEDNGYCMTTFNPDDSSSFVTVDEGGFDIAYLDGREIEGDYINETVTIGGKSITQQKLGLATKSVRPTGIMGLGFDTNVASSTKYATILDNMVSQGVIEAKAFSLYLNDVSESSGTILFGGIDSKKFVGNLTTLPLRPDFQSFSDNITSFTVELNSLKITGQSVTMDSLTADAILDSGSTICLLPESQTSDIYDAFDIRTVSGVSVPFVDCAYADSKGSDISFDFTFSDKTIQVPMSGMVVDAFADIQDQIMNDPTLSQIFDGWKGACMFGVASASDYGVDDENFALLGDTFLRSAYLVYDLDNQQIGIAESNTGTNDSDVVELKAGDTEFPSVTGVTSKSSSSSTATASSTARQTVTVTATPDGSSGDNGNAGGQLMAPAVMVSLMMAVGAAVVMM